MKDQSGQRMQRTHRGGYTLLELMIAVAILAVLAALALPAVSGVLAKQRMKSATQEVIHLVDLARVQATSRNRAYEMVINLQSSTITLNESESTRCDGFAGGVGNIRHLDFVAGTPTDDLREVALTAVMPLGLGNGTFNLCFKPDGRVLQTDTGRPIVSSSTGYGAGEASISLRRRASDGTAFGIVHRVVIPYNGIPTVVYGSGAGD